jgi:N-acetyl-anhydromuramyl-L-alanine amidase AmpD
VILPNGKVEIGRGDDAVGAHVEGFNSRSWGISIVGGLDAKGKPANTMTPAQEAALERELRAALKKYPKAVICGHRDLSPDQDGDGMIEPNEWTKMCPCFDVIPWANARGLPGAPIRGVWDKKAPMKPFPPEGWVADLQRLLAGQGFVFGPIDGVVGPRTTAAIKAFQISVGLPRTGRFDEATAAKLQALTKAAHAA